jgi:hypothetical protein
MENDVIAIGIELKNEEDVITSKQKRQVLKEHRRLLYDL